MSDNLASISRKLKSLPLPRLQLTWRTNPEGSEYQWSCDYELLVPIGKYDIRNNGPRGKVGGGPGYIKCTLGGCQSTGRGPLSFDETLHGWCLDTPFRDGAHAGWDSFRLGFPAYVVYQDGDVTYTRFLPSMEPS